MTEFARKQRKAVVIAVVIGAALSAALAIYLERPKSAVAVEFGSSASARNELVALLTERGVKYQIEEDHLGRVWVVPDQSKLKEFQQAMSVLESRRQVEVNQSNAAIKVRQ